MLQVRTWFNTQAKRNSPGCPASTLLWTASSGDIRCGSGCPQCTIHQKERKCYSDLWRNSCAALAGLARTRASPWRTGLSIAVENECRGSDADRAPEFAGHLLSLCPVNAARLSLMGWVDESGRLHHRGRTIISSHVWLVMGYSDLPWSDSCDCMMGALRRQPFTVWPYPRRVLQPPFQCSHAGILRSLCQATSYQFLGLRAWST